MMSMFVEGSIFTLSGDTFPPGHELGRSVRRFPVAMWWAAMAKATLGWKPSSQSQEGSLGVLAASAEVAASGDLFGHPHRSSCR